MSVLQKHIAIDSEGGGGRMVSFRNAFLFVFVQIPSYICGFVHRVAVSKSGGSYRATPFSFVRRGTGFDVGMVV